MKTGEKLSELDIRITADTSVKEMVVRQGDAKKIYEPVRQNITGAITAPAEWLRVRNSVKETDHVIFNNTEMTIAFVYNERMPEGGAVMGALKYNPDLLAILNLNMMNQYTPKELGALLKRNRVFFTDRDENSKMVTLLNNFTANVQSEIEANQDTRGNKKASFEKKVTTNMPAEFKLTMPIYVGFAPKTFRVEICFDTTESTVRCWMESPELHEISITERDRIITEQLKPFRDAGLAVIEK